LERHSAIPESVAQNAASLRSSTKAILLSAILADAVAPRGSAVCSWEYCMEFWKTLIAPTLVAIITGFIFFEAGRLTAPDVPDIEASVTSLRVPNPFVGHDSAPLVSAAEKILGYSLLGNDLSIYLHFNSQLNIGIIHIDNRSNVKSKGIEVLVDRSTLFSSGENPASNRIQVSPLDPGAETYVYFLGDAMLFSSNDVRIMHDDRRVDVLMDDDRYKYIDRFFEKYGLLAYMIFAFALVSSISFVVSLISSALSSSSLEARARSISKSEAERMAILLEYLKLHHPDKLSTDSQKEGQA
jgi:hypothetical protein